MIAKTMQEARAAGYIESIPTTQHRGFVIRPMSLHEMPADGTCNLIGIAPLPATKKDFPVAYQHYWTEHCRRGGFMHITDNDGHLIAKRTMYISAFERNGNKLGTVQMWLQAESAAAIQRAVEYIDSWHDNSPVEMPEINWQ